jgi:opacity protein-like surface antigen
MRSDRETSWPRRRRPLRRSALVIVAVAFLTVVSRSAVAGDGAVPDNRTTQSGKPLVFRASDAVAWDRDDQAAAAGAIDRSRIVSERPDHSADQTGLLTQLRFASEPRLADSRVQPNLAAAAQNSADRAPSPAEGAPSPASPALPVALPDDPSPTEHVPLAPPIGKNRSATAPPDIGRRDLAEPSPDGLPNDRGGPPLSGHSDLPAGEWPHGYLREQLAEPLVGASWSNEPYHVDWFLGMIRGTEIIRDHVDQNVGVVGGFRLGWDYDLYWGLETRLGFSSLEDQPEAAPLAGSADKVILWDTSLVYYPWGDSRFRPYFGIGLGLAEFRFTDDFGQQIQRNLVEMPIGVGLKYRLHDWITLRADVTDNLALGSSGLATMNNFSFTTGMEYRFGGCHRSYWPWEPASAH